MELIKDPSFIYKEYNEQVIVFVPNTGQTHCLDGTTKTLLNQLATDQPSSASKLKQFFMQDCTNDEKAILNNYIQDMIDNLLQLKLIHTYSI